MIEAKSHGLTFGKLFDLHCVTPQHTEMSCMLNVNLCEYLLPTLLGGDCASKLRNMLAQH